MYYLYYPWVLGLQEDLRLDPLVEANLCPTISIYIILTFRYQIPCKKGDTYTYFPLVDV